MTDGVDERVDQTPRIFPTNAGVGDALAVRERLAGNKILSSRLEMAFQHYTDNARIAGADLCRDIMADCELFHGFFTAIAMAAIDHDPRGYTGFGETFRRSIDVGGVIVWMFSAAQDHMAVFVAGR